MELKHFEKYSSCRKFNADFKYRYTFLVLNPVKPNVLDENQAHYLKKKRTLENLLETFLNFSLVIFGPLHKNTYMYNSIYAAIFTV